MCATMWCHLVNATKVTAGLAESNGNLPPGGWLNVTCGLTACTPGSALGPMLGNEYGRTLSLITTCKHVSTVIPPPNTATYMIYNSQYLQYAYVCNYKI